MLLAHLQPLIIFLKPLSITNLLLFKISHQKIFITEESVHF